MVTFSEVPAAIRVPGVYVEVGANAANASLAQQRYRLGLIGQKLSSGTAAANEPVRVTRAEDARVLFGSGSMLAEMSAAALANGRFIEVFAIPMADPTGEAAEGSLNITASGTRAGDIALYVGGVRVPVAVATGDTAAQIATKIAARINARADLSVTATANAASVVVTAKHDGIIGNSIDLRVSALEGEILPTGVAVSVTAMADGAGVPDLASALTALGDTHYNVVAAPYTDSASLTTIVAEMEDRSVATRQLGGVAITASTADLAALETLGASRNSERLVIVGAPKAPSPAWVWAAAVAGIVARDAQEDPARPFSTAELRGVLPARSADRPNDLERDALLNTGIATTVVNGGGTPAIERLITTYQTNDLGADDPTFLDLGAVLTLELIRFEMRQLGSKFARFKVADDGQAFAPGQEVLTPAGLRGEIVALYAGWVERGLCENSPEFAEALIVERDAQDRGRLNVAMNPDIVNALRVLGVRVSLTL